MNTTHALPARNAEIVRRRLAGETPTALAQEYGVSISRISMLVRKDRERTEAASRKPRMRQVEHGLWECSDATVTRRGETQEEAYSRWLTESIASYMRPAKTQAKPLTVKAKAPAVREPEQPYRGEVTVVRGALVARRPLTLSGDKQMAMAMERAGKAQAPIRGMCGPSPSARAA